MNWLDELLKNKKAVPILSFPMNQLWGTSIKEFVQDSHLQALGMQEISKRYNPGAVCSPMDLSVEAECFGAEVLFNDDDVPNVVGSIVSNEDEAKSLKIPFVGEGRTQIYIDGVKEALTLVDSCPVLAGMIGPFSLAGRLIDVSEAMIYCYDEPNMVHMVLEKVTKFIIEYGKAYKSIGADGVIIAEPLAGVLSPALAKEFSHDYVQKIIKELKSDDFAVIYHNCGNNTIYMLDDLFQMEASAYHFGNAIDILDVLKHSQNHIIMGNIDPVGILKEETPENIYKKTIELLKQTENEKNFIISSGCDIPLTTSLDNIEAFMKASQDFYE